MLNQRVAIALGCHRQNPREESRRGDFKEVVEEIVGCALSELRLPENAAGGEPAQQYNAAIKSLEPVSLAEYHLAVARAKVSTHSCYHWLSPPILAIVNLGRRTLVASGEAVRSDRDPRLRKLQQHRFSDDRPSGRRTGR